MADRKIVLFIATSLDGYIATTEGSLDWLFEAEGEGDNGFADFYESTDALIMGKSTYDHVMEMTENKYPHADRKSYVFTSDTTAMHEAIEFINEDVVTFTKRLKKEEGKNIWLIGGSQLLDAFMKKNLVDEYIITHAPVLLGNGIPLFREGNPTIKLQLKETKRYGSMVQNHYVKK